MLMSETQLVLKGYGARHAPDNSISGCEAVSGRKIVKIAKPDFGRWAEVFYELRPPPAALWGQREIHNSRRVPIPRRIIAKRKT